MQGEATQVLAGQVVGARAGLRDERVVGGGRVGLRFGGESIGRVEDAADDFTEREPGDRGARADTQVRVHERRASAGYRGSTQDCETRRRTQRGYGLR